MNENEEMTDLFELIGTFKYEKLVTCWFYSV